ncbi:skp1 family, dimerization domain-containing protein [Ditylenchus destructor]|uniref:Skp1-related protein n=1 Tax=Ditylenchus destructor TaxID=166010 RepID=A0AAD4MGR5_9BILA|nr:skp1 family, dimerization domain-containing protein [Ditylenchus destructor]
MSEDYVVDVHTNDGKVVKVDFEAMKQSLLFRDMLDALSIDSRETGRVEFPVQKINAATMDNVAEWCRNHVGAPEPVIQEKPDTKERIWFDFNEWESKFFQELEVQEIIDLASAADYLQVAALYLYCCQELARRMREVNLDPVKIREMFNLEDDLTDEEKKEIQEKNVWINY